MSFSLDFCFLFFFFYQDSFFFFFKLIFKVHVQKLKHAWKKMSKLIVLFIKWWSWCTLFFFVRLCSPPKLYSFTAYKSVFTNEGEDIFVLMT